MRKISLIIALIVVGFIGCKAQTMEYKITAVRVVGETLYTTIEYTIDKKTITVEVPNFQPADDKAVEKGIENRYLSEKKKYEAEKKCLELLPVIQAKVGIKVVKEENQQ